jgi:hypothetical protein
MDHTPAAEPLYGLMAEFESPTTLVAAAKATHDQGYRKFDAYSPFPIHDLFGAMHIEDRRVPLIVLGGGITGLLAGLGLQVYVSYFAYPLNIGGKPYLSWPMFVPVAFELTILFAALSAVFGMFILNGLPMPYHPVFNVPRFKAASQDGFFLAIESTDPMFDREQTHVFLKNLGAREINEVAP